MIQYDWYDLLKLISLITFNKCYLSKITVRYNNIYYTFLHMITIWIWETMLLSFNPLATHFLIIIQILYKTFNICHKCTHNFNCLIFVTFFLKLHRNLKNFLVWTQHFFNRKLKVLGYKDISEGKFNNRTRKINISHGLLK